MEEGEVDVLGPLLVGAVARGIEGLELLAGEVGELVQAHGPGVTLGVVLGDLGGVGREDGATESNLGLGRVGLSVLGCPLREGHLGGDGYLRREERK